MALFPKHPTGRMWPRIPACTNCGKFPDQKNYLVGRKRQAKYRIGYWVECITCHKATRVRFALGGPHTALGPAIRWFLPTEYYNETVKEMPKP